ncbi:MAG: ACP S-malonyltransferase [Campylobacterales bacterium]
MKQCFIFPGQGSQSVGMAKDFYDNNPLVRELFAEANEALGFSFEELMFEKNERLDISEYSQPAIVLASIAALSTFKAQCPITPSLLLGHSLGEYSALFASGAIEFSDVLKLVNKRGQLMQKAAKGREAGMAVILGLSDEVVEDICKSLQNEGKEIWPANYNTQGQIVIAGIKDDLKDAEARFKEAKAKRYMLLNMSVSSHNPLLESIQPEFETLLNSTIKDSFSAPIVSNVNAKPYSSKSEAISLLKKQLTMPVLYKQSIIEAEALCDAFVEFGSGSVLSGLNKKITKKRTITINSVEAVESFKNGDL